jgi:hypothetical protein
MKSTLTKLKQMIRSAISQETTDALDTEAVKRMARGIATTRSDEIGCDECFEQVDQFVEVALAGKDAAEAMPLVQDHLNRCQDCREEFEALLSALRAVG